MSEDLPSDALIILDSIPDALARTDGGFLVSFVNRAMEQFFGKSRAEMLGRVIWDLYPEVSRAPLEADFRRAMDGRLAVTFDAPQKCIPGPHSLTALPDAGGGLVVRFGAKGGELEAALRKYQEKFSKVFQFSPVPMCIVDLDRNSTFLEINQAFATISGYSRDELIGHTSSELGLYYDTKDLEESRRRIRKEGGYRNVEIRFRRRNGDVLIGLISAEALQIEGSFCAIAAAVDITEERRAQRALRESEDLYRRLFDVESDALLLVDQESGRVLAANVAATQLYGYNRQELLSKNRTDLSAEPEETIRSTTGKETFVALRWHLKKNGTVFPVEISSCHFDLRGQAVFLSAIRDITNRRRLQTAVQKAEEKFHKAFQSNPAALTITDLESRTYLDVNGSFQELTGYRREEVVGRHWADLSLWVDPQWRDEVVLKLRQDGKLLNTEFQLRKKDGSISTGLISAEVIEIEGKPCAITATMDVTERHRLEGRLRQAQKLESLGRLAGGVAHDFNNLLTIINGYSDMIIRGASPSDAAYLPAQEIQKAGTRAAGLAAQLLAFSRKQVIQPRPLDINAVVSDSDRMLQRLIGEDIRLTTSLDLQLGQVMADPDQIHQVIMNLAVNARDAMPNGGEVRIATSNAEIDEGAAAAFPEALPGRYVTLSITDTGIGMDEETVQNAFEPFFTTKERGGGTGLGLATVHGIVHQSGGWIDVTSAPGEGSKFSIYLPRIDSRTVLDRPPAAPPPEMAGHETVLLVEDQEEVRRYAATILKSRGYHVLEASDGYEASRMAQEYAEEIDLLLTDVIMPGMNGKELADHLRQSRPELKVIFMSGYPADMIASRGVMEEDAAYLPKPFSPDTLAAKIRDLLSAPPVSGSGQNSRRKTGT